VRAIKDPMGFAQAVRDLGFAYPETRERAPRKVPGWLVKRRAAAGGGHVRPARHLHAPHGRGWYWQRRAPGRPVSALLVADGRRARVLGFSEQWSDPGPGRRFRFAGVAAPAALSPAARATLTAAASALAARYEVRGLASLDALVAGDRVVVLEVNPRPGASLDAYERCYGVNLFALHRSTCMGELPEPPQPAGAAGSAILYAPRALQVPHGFAWPAWTADRTPPGVRVPARGPVCTLQAVGIDMQAVRTALLERQATLLERLGGVRRAARRRSSAGSPSRDAGRAIGRPGTAR
jgi:predicted ATP-grasp superfamily ATP-dependent carboligase